MPTVSDAEYAELTSLREAEEKCQAEKQKQAEDRKRHDWIMRTLVMIAFIPMLGIVFSDLLTGHWPEDNFGPIPLRHWVGMVVAPLFYFWVLRRDFKKRLAKNPEAKYYD